VCRKRGWEEEIEEKGETWERCWRGWEICGRGEERIGEDVIATKEKGVSGNKEGKVGTEMIKKGVERKDREAKREKVIGLKRKEGRGNRWGETQEEKMEIQGV